MIDMGKSIKAFFSRPTTKLEIIEVSGLLLCLCVIIGGLANLPFNYQGMAVSLLVTLLLWVVEFRRVYFT